MHDFKLKQQIIKVLPELKKIPYSRIFDEVLKIFLTGHAEKSLNLFINFNLSRKVDYSKNIYSDNYLTSSLAQCLSSLFS